MKPVARGAVPPPRRVPSTIRKPRARFQAQTIYPVWTIPTPTGGGPWASVGFRGLPRAPVRDPESSRERKAPARGSMSVR